MEHTIHTKHTGHITAVVNQKGGVGKSTTAEALAEGLILKGKRTLLIDLDPQGSITLIAGTDANSPTIYDALTKQVDAAAAIQKRKGRVDIIPAGRNLARLDVELTDAGKEYRLKERLSPLLSRFDFIIIDTSPALGILTVNALTAANSIIIPAQADIYSLQGISQLAETIGAIRTYTNPGLKLMGVLLTRHNPHTVIARDMAEVAGTVAKQIGTFLYDAVIHETVAIKEAQASRQPVYQYAPKSKAAVDYMSFTREFLERSRNHA